MPKISKRSIDALKPDPTRDVFMWDSELRGFGVRLKPTGVGSYLAQYRTPQGRTRRLAFGRVGTITAEQARGAARALLAQARAGADPSAERHVARKALTFGEVLEKYMEANR